LIVMATGVTSFPLPGLKFDDMLVQMAYLMKAVDSRENIEVGSHELFESVMKWLWYSVSRPILDHLGYLKPPAPGEPWPRICWILGGMFSLFPIHASGDYQHARDTGDPSTVLDRIISSYSPTFKALIHALRYAWTSDTKNTGLLPEALIVKMENTPELPEHQQLRKTGEETSLVMRYIESSMPVKVLTDPAQKDVLSILSAYKILHFNCHGVSDPNDPSKSRLLLRDWKRNPLTFRHLSQLQLTGCRLAYLSACETARNINVPLSNESIHLAAGFQLAGVSTVIATAWEIYEDDSLEVVEMVYKYLSEGTGQLKYERCAEALHNALRNLRDGGKRPLDWGAYILYGV
jgi:hypothetical protein